MSQSTPKLARPPEHMMRYMHHIRSKAFISAACGCSLGLGIAFVIMYVEARRKAFVEFGKKYDPYQRMREICDYPIKYMHTCPTELAKRFEEKGLVVADPEYTIPIDETDVKGKKEYIYSNALERFLDT